VAAAEAHPPCDTLVLVELLLLVLPLVEEPAFVLPLVVAVPDVDVWPLAFVTVALLVQVTLVVLVWLFVHVLVELGPVFVTVQLL
jgi:hypothetical protein